MYKMTKTANSAMLAALFGHLLCCGLPMAANILALVAGIGVFSTITPWLNVFHEFMHGYELYLLVFSAATVMFGIAVHYVSAKRDCGTETCGHAPCAPKKRKARTILWLTIAMLLVNLISYASHQTG